MLTGLWTHPEDSQNYANVILSSADIVHGNIRRVSEFIKQSLKNQTSISGVAFVVQHQN
jgi:hypothetical protein